MSEGDAGLAETTAVPRAAQSGLFDRHYAAFLSGIAPERAQLHRYCARMTGSVLDGEDLVQETLLEAYRKIDMLDDAAALRPWLFRIAHNRCIDFLRRRRAREQAEGRYAEPEEAFEPAAPAGAGAGRAIERLVMHLPPKERACVLLKDVFDHSLEEIAELVGTTVGAVKAALNRGRGKLAALPPDQPPAPRPDDADLIRLLRRYVELFNRRDWDGVRALTSADAQLRVSDCFKGRLADSPYFAEFTRAEIPWRLSIGTIDGETVLLVLRLDGDVWRIAYPVRIAVGGGMIVAIADYYACPWLLAAAGEVAAAQDREA